MTISTEATAALSPPLRRPRLIEVVLILSVALNCFIVGGVVMTAWHFRHPPMPPPDMEIAALAGAAGLSPEETDDLMSLSRSVHLNIAIERADIRPLADAYLNELSQPIPKKDVLDKLETQIRSEKVAMHIKISNDFIQWIEEISPEKRKIIVDKIRDEHDPASRGLKWIIGM